MKCECGFASEKINRWPFRCKCGREHIGTETMTNEPGIVAKAVSFCAEKVKWNLAGRPTRTAEQQQVCLAICTTCEMFDSEKVKCLKCGCNLKAAVKMATKTCPLGKWPDTTTPAAP